MGRSGYHDDCGGWDLIRWRGAVASAIRGERGQALLRGMLEALDAMPQKRLVASVLVNADGECCGLGSVALARGLQTEGVDPKDRDEVAKLFGVAPALVAEIAFINDDDFSYRAETETPEARFWRVRTWVAEQIRPEP